MINDLNDDDLRVLRTLSPEAPSLEARKRAVNAAVAAFEARHGRQPLGRTRWLDRWRMAAGLAVPAGVAFAVALVFVPLGSQLSPFHDQTSSSEAPVKVVAQNQTASDLNPVPAVPPSGARPLARLAATAEPTPAPLREAAPLSKPALALPAPAAPDMLAQEDHAATPLPAAAPPAVGSLATTVPNGDVFTHADDNRVKITRDEPVSTFSIDVDTASYAYVRGLLQQGDLPSPDAIRVEELINYFPYDYPAPTTAETPFKATLSIMPTPWNKKTQLLQIGIEGYVPPPAERRPMHLTFLIDTSGSMDEPNKLPLLKRSFGLLIDTLRPADTVAIVTYAGSAGIALPPTIATDRAKIMSALESLGADGSTNGSGGLSLAYQVAESAMTPESVNRIVLATDGDFNVGIDDPDALKTFVATQRKTGVTLSVLGFGRGNLDDAVMQSLAQNGNGNASYIDSFREAQKVLVEEAGANFVTIAKDVKLQVEFNPAAVSEYRLIGYETRLLNREDFNNDAVDAGEIGAGHTVTALYEITPAGSGAELNDPLRYAASPPENASNDEIGFLKIRYKAPDGDESRLITTPITRDLAVDDVAKASPDSRFAAAVAAFGQKLKDSPYLESMPWQQISDLADSGKGLDKEGYRAEFLQLVKLAGLLQPHPTSFPQGKR